MRRQGSCVAFVWLCVAGVSVLAQGPGENRVVYWPAAELRHADVDELTPQAKTASSGVGAKTYMEVPTHKALIAHREARPGVPELHKAETDFFVIQAGGGVLLVGGEILDRKDTAAGATGSSIRGGERHSMGVGDVIHIPANVPHSWLLTAGQSVTYFVIKVEETR